MSNSAYRDGPNQIKYEAQQISLTFVKETPDTGLLSWNIPAPVFGCDEDARAYNGIILTASSVPVTQAQKPVNGTVYSGDATVSPTIHAADVLGEAKVIGTFYDDDVTTSMRVADLEPHTAYYFSAYAVTAQGIYDPAGAHAYSLPMGKETAAIDYPGYQEVRVLGQANKRVNIRNYRELPLGSMLGQAATNLDPSVEYTVTICSDLLGENVELPITGMYAQTWDDLVKELNRQIALSLNPVMSASPPNTGSLFLDVTNDALYQWTGSVYERKSLVVTTADPTTPVVGSWWFDETNQRLYQYASNSWIETFAYKYSKPYNHITAGDVWINPLEGFAAKWEGSTWCRRALYQSAIDPSLAVGLLGGTFWYNEKDGVMHEWNVEGQCWNPIHVMYSAQDPTNLLPGQKWYNYMTNVLYELSAPYEWVAVSARVHEIAPKTPIDGAIWINPRTDEVKQYVFTDKEWVTVDAIHWGSDPMDRESCDKWWNAQSDILYIWDFLTSSWVEVVNFVQSAIDPSLAPTLPAQAIWTSPEGIVEWDGMQWVEREGIIINHDPRTPMLNDVVHTGQAFLQYNGSVWIELDVSSSEGLPTVASGTYWYDPSTLALNMWNGSVWTPQMYVTRPQIPETGSQYYNTSTKQLMEWKNGKYEVAELPAHFLINELNNLMAVSKTKGSKSFVKLGFDINFKQHIKPLFFGFEAVGGTDGISPTPAYKTQGVGTDGSVDERREYANYVLAQLGYPKVQVELTKQQLDQAIDDALEVLRQRTSAAYTRSYMALDIYPNQQAYELSNRSQGLDRVTRVMKVLRTRYGRIGAYSYEDTFGSAMIQQLYYAGSFDLLSYHLLSSYNELINNIFANDVTFNWNEYTRTLYIQQVLRNKERVLVEVELEKTEQELLVDRNLRSWIKKYVMGRCMIILGEIRGKFGSLPGAGGGVALNGTDLVTRGEALIEQCQQDIDTQIISGLDQYGSSSVIIMG